MPISKYFLELIARLTRPLYQVPLRLRTEKNVKAEYKQLFIAQDLNILLKTPAIQYVDETEGVKLLEYGVDIVKISIVKYNNKIVYIVKEPPLTTTLKEAIFYSINKYLEIYDVNPIYEDENVLNVFISLIKESDSYKELVEQMQHTLIYYLNKILSGYGPLYPLVNDDYIEDITYEGHFTPVAVYHKLFSEYRWINTNILLNEDESRKIAMILSYKIGRPLSISNPHVEGLTYEGHRINLTLGNEITLRGTTIIIRRRPTHVLTIVDLIRNNTLSLEQAAYLMYLLEHQYSILIIGGVASGKTTLLRALLTLVPDNAKIITIEDTPELQLPHTHWDPLIVRRLRSTLKDITDELELLTRIALRRRGDYLVIGESRGREAKLLIQASTLGYGSLTTFHANSIDAAITRLTSPPISIERQNLMSTFKIIVLLGRIYIPEKGYIRRVLTIAETLDNDIIDVFSWSREEDLHKPSDIVSIASRSKRLLEIAKITGKTLDELVHELELRKEFLRKITVENVNDPRQIVDLVTKFYNDLLERKQTYLAGVI